MIIDRAPHCGYCGRPTHACTCGTMPAAAAPWKCGRCGELGVDRHTCVGRRADPLASVRADLPAIRERARLAVSIGGNQATLKQLARDVLTLLDAIG